MRWIYALIDTLFWENTNHALVFQPAYISCNTLRTVFLCLSLCYIVCTSCQFNESNHFQMIFQSFLCCDIALSHVDRSQAYSSPQVFLFIILTFKYKEPVFQIMVVVGLLPVKYSFRLLFLS